MTDDNLRRLYFHAIKPVSSMLGFIEFARTLEASSTRTQGADEDIAAFGSAEKAAAFYSLAAAWNDANKEADRRADDAQPVAMTAAEVDELGLKVGLMERAGRSGNIFASELSRSEMRAAIRALIATRDAAPRADAQDAERYRKLRKWMSSNVDEGWREVTRLAAVACYVDWENFDHYLDGLPECNVGLCESASAPRDK